MPPAALPPHPAVRLPNILHRFVEARLAALLIPAGADADAFVSPALEPALSASDSVSWQVFKNPITVFIGGVAAVILELAEPRVRSGVWDHTTFRTRPLARMQRTGYAAMMTVYGPRSRAVALIATVHGRHGKVVGTTPEGTPYRATDDALLTWVQATAQFGFLEAYVRYVRALPPGERDAFHAEGQAAARLHGVATPLASEADVRALFDQMRPALEPSPIVIEFLGIARRMPALPWFTGPLQGWLVKAAVACLPEEARVHLGLDGAAWTLAGWQRALVRWLARGADRLALATHPAVQACRRMGLADDALYRR